MTPEQFTYWLAGVLSQSKDDSKVDAQIRSVLEEVIRKDTKNVSTADMLRQIATKAGVATCNPVTGKWMNTPGTTTPPLTVHNDT